MSPLKIVFTCFYLLVFPAILFFIAGDWRWKEGWIFSVWFMIMCVSIILYLYKNDPALLTERYRKPGEGNQKGWDKFVVYGLMIGFISWIAIMPLDAKRFGWTAGFPLFLKIFGGVELLLSYFFFFRSYSDNTFLSPLVRIQTERKQKLVTTGVYGFVRHPMYLAAVLMFVGAPLLLGSYFGIAVGLLIIVLLAFRTLGEERMLATEFEEYAEYKKKVRYRFIPFVW